MCQNNYNERGNAMFDLSMCVALGLIDKSIVERVRGCLKLQNNVLNENPILNNVLMSLKEYDDVTFKHSINVAVYATAIGLKINLPDSMIFLLTQAGLFHDIGKILISKSILNKNTSLTDDEFALIKMHTKFGLCLGTALEFPRAVNDGIYQHHERMNGKGYPDGLKGEAISIFGRILAVADVYDALVSVRPYHKSFPPSKPIEDLASDSGYDKRMVYAFFEAINPYPKDVKCLVINASDGSHDFKVDIQ